MYYDDEKYHLHAWVIMPNHVHVLATMINETALANVLHDWKGYTAQEANRVLDRSGAFWQRAYYDRYMRDVDHFWRTVRYIEYNPVTGELCEHPADWTWGSASYREENDTAVMDYDRSNREADRGEGG